MLSSYGILHTAVIVTSIKYQKLLLLLLSNGRSWVYSISLLASQYSFGRSLAVLSSFGHFSRCSLSITVFLCLHIVQ